VIGGAVDEGETPLGAAKRELLEESGLIARSWTYLGSAELGTASLDGSMHFFVARVLIQGTPKPETTEKLLIKEFGLGEAIDMACNGSICHLPSIVLLLRLALEGK
jgi:8-oxo-dGTP pyrophosphatase MutT (NUDIX family)